MNVLKTLSTKGTFKNDVTRLVGRRVPKISDKKLHRGRGYMEIVISPLKENMYKF